MRPLAAHETQGVPMRLANRRDVNHADIADAFRRMGWSVADTSRIGGGFPDLCIAKRGITVLIEVKAKNGKLRKSQIDFAVDWHGMIFNCRTIDDVATVSAMAMGKVTDENNRAEAP